MKRNENKRDRRGLSLFKIRFGLSTIRPEDEFSEFFSMKPEVRPEYIRWFGGLHDLDCNYVCQVL